MAFGNISLPAGAFQQPDIAGSFLQGLGAMQRIRTSQAAADDIERDAALKQRALDAENEWGAAVRNNPGEQGLAALYAADPVRAAAHEKQLLELNKLRGEGAKVNAETQGRGIENEGKNEDIAKQEAVGAAHYWKALGPNANPETLKAFLISRANTWRGRNDTVAQQLEQSAGNPDVLPHIMAVAKMGGYKDPDEEVQRNIYQSVETERGKNSLPPSQYQQAQLNQSGQQAQTQAQQAQWGAADGLRKEFNALPEVGEYHAILPLSQAVRQAAQVDNQAADLDMIYGVARMLDPKGVVRESDSSMVVATGSPAQQYLGLFNSVAGGGKLTPEVRKNMLQIADRREGAAKAAYNAQRKAFGGIVQQRGVDPSLVFSEPMTPGGQQTQAPAGGQPTPAPAGGGVREGQTATNRATGQKMVFRGGQWQPL